MVKSFCVRGKKYTDSINPKIEATKNGRYMEKSTCANCGSTKTKFVKNNSGNGIIRSLGKWIDRKQHGSSVDIQKHLSKLGELHMRTPSGKKYNYCGPGTKLEERLASNDPTYRDPINKLIKVCHQHDIDYSNAKSLSDKHIADDLMLKRISEIPYKERPWGTTAVQAIIGSKRKLGLGVPKNGKSRRVKRKTGKKN